MRRLIFAVLSAAVLGSAGPAAAAPRHVRRFPGPRRAAAPNPTDVVAPQLNYYGGKVIPSSKIVAVYWGTPGPAGFTTRLEEFYRAFVASPVFDFLGEYSTTRNDVNGNAGTQQTIARGTFAGGITITPSVTTAAIGAQDIETELGKQIDAQVLPAPGDDTLYAVHLAPGVSIDDPGFSSCVDFCAYHSSFTHGAGGPVVYYALLPDHSPPSSCSGCGEATDWFANLTGSVSHEVAEAVTDADVGNDTDPTSCGPAWCDPAQSDNQSPHAEIGDICEVGAVTEAPFLAQDGVTSWVVQRLWSNAAHGCIVSSQTAVTTTLTPATAVRAGATLDFAVHTTAPAQGTAPQVALTTFELPAGVTAIFDQPELAAGHDTTLHLQFTSSAPDDFSFGVSAEAGSSQGLVAASVSTADFSATAPTEAIAITAGASASAQVATATFPANSPATPLTASTGEAGFTAAIAPAAQAGQTATLVLTAAHGLPSGSSALSVTLSNGARAHSIQIKVNVDGDDAGLVPPANGLSVSQGSSRTVAVQTQTVHGQAQQLALSMSDLPLGVTASFDPPTVLSGAIAQLKLVASGTAVPQTGSALLVYAGPYSSQSARVSLTVSSGGCTSAAAVGPWMAALLLFVRRRRWPNTIS